jgi:hypothetical protein
LPHRRGVTRVRPPRRGRRLPSRATVAGRPTKGQAPATGRGVTAGGAPVRNREAPIPGPAVPSPERARFVLLSFEGPDPLSAAGGVAIRVTGLAEAPVG